MGIGVAEHVVPCSTSFVRTTATGGGSGPPLPSQVALWFDAADDATFTYGTSPQVATWVDKSANAFTVSRTPDANVQRNRTINGLPAVSCANAPKLQRTGVNLQALVDPTSHTNCMSFAVLVIDNVSFATWWSITATSRLGFDERGTTAYIDIGPVPAARLTGAISNLTATPYVFAAYRNGGAIALFRNGVQILSTATASGSVPSETATLLMAGVSDGGYLAGATGEIIHVANYDANLFTQFTNYLRSKWGV